MQWFRNILRGMCGTPFKEARPPSGTDSIFTSWWHLSQLLCAKSELGRISYFGKDRWTLDRQHSFSIGLTLRSSKRITKIIAGCGGSGGDTLGLLCRRPRFTCEFYGHLGYCSSIRHSGRPCDSVLPILYCGKTRSLPGHSCASV